MSGHATPTEALRRGARAMLRKPFSPGELLAVVRAAAVTGQSGAREAFLAPLAPLAPPDGLAAWGRLFASNARWARAQRFREG